MDCLTDSTCIATLFDTLNQLASTIDYYGYVLFGAEWSPVGPGIEAHTEGVVRIVNAVLVQEPAQCQRFAMLGGVHA